MKTRLVHFVVIIAALTAFTVLGVCWLHAGGEPAGLLVVGRAVAYLASALTRLGLSGCPDCQPRPKSTE